jgi:hypothetical protein
MEVKGLTDTFWWYTNHTNSKQESCIENNLAVWNVEPSIHVSKANPYSASSDGSVVGEGCFKDFSDNFLDGNHLEGFALRPIETRSVIKPRRAGTGVRDEGRLNGLARIPALKH